MSVVIGEDYKGEEDYKREEDYKGVIAENHNLIYSFLNKYNYNIDEYYDIVAIGLVKAVRSYNPDKGKLSTWAYKIMSNEIKQSFRKNKLMGNITSIDCVLSDADGELRLVDILGSKVITEDEVVYIADIDLNTKYLNLTEIELLASKVMGKTNRVLAEEYGCSTAYISKVITQAFKVLTGGKVSKQRLKYKAKIDCDRELRERFNKAKDIINEVIR